jgi:hypothetical protein
LDALGCQELFQCPPETCVYWIFHAASEGGPFSTADRETFQSGLGQKARVKSESPCMYFDVRSEGCASGTGFVEEADSLTARSGQAAILTPF